MKRRNAPIDLPTLVLSAVATLPALAGSAALAALAAPAVGGPPQTGDLPAPPKGLEPAPVLLASDGKAVAPGRIPEGTSERARTLWQRAVAATGGGTSEPLDGFDLNFDIRIRRESSANDLGKVRYRFWAEPEYLHSDWTRSGRVQLRGPQGDWLVEKGVKTELVGRENKQSQKELSEWVAIASNFLALATPSSTRLVALEEVERLDVAFPTGPMVERAAKLDWLLVRSPDFRVIASGDTTRNAIYRAYLGLDRETGAVRLAVLHDDDARSTVDESTVLVEIVDWTDLGKRRLPLQLRVYRTKPDRRKWYFEDRPAADLYLLEGGTLAPKFQPGDFLP